MSQQSRPNTYDDDISIPPTPEPIPPNQNFDQEKYNELLPKIIEQKVKDCDFYFLGCFFFTSGLMQIILEMIGLSIGTPIIRIYNGIWTGIALIIESFFVFYLKSEKSKQRFTNVQIFLVICFFFSMFNGVISLVSYGSDKSVPFLFQGILSIFEFIFEIYFIIILDKTTRKAILIVDPNYVFPTVD
ncbi:unnamed protein product [Brachionus calyciflorus]|uniref:Uncharacterized protein n=1 Tax=Brachionus calyciflorus TaxID=104777 RepID=A0A814DWP7_9BILA|nr:unnamed protein product [Brachionus calyciflorus]